MPNDDNDTLRIENAILKVRDELKDHINAKHDELKQCTEDRFKELPCSKNEGEIKKNRLLIYVLLATSGLLTGSGGYSLISKFIMASAGG